MGICNGKPIEQRSRQSRRQVSAETNETSEVGLNKSFGFSRHFSTHYEIDGQVGRGDLAYWRSTRDKEEVRLVLGIPERRLNFEFR